MKLSVALLIGAAALSSPAWAQDVPDLPAVGLRPHRHRSRDQTGRRLLRVRQRQISGAFGHPGGPADGFAPVRDDRPHGSQPPPASAGGRARSRRTARRRARQGRRLLCLLHGRGADRPHRRRRDRSGARCDPLRLDAGRAVGADGPVAYDFYPAIAGLFIDSDLKAPERYAVYLNQSGLGLPDRDYYLKPEFAAQRQAYADYATQLLTLIGWDDPAGAAARAIAFETKIAEDSWDKTKLRDPTIQYNPHSPAELATLAPGFDWTALLGGAKLGDRDRLSSASPMPSRASPRPMPRRRSTR